jgi:hypothetical protein
MSERITIDLDADTARALEQRARENGRTAAEEARALVRSGFGVSSTDRSTESSIGEGKHLVDRIHEIVAPYGGFDVPEVVWPEYEPRVVFD